MRNALILGLVAAITAGCGGDSPGTDGAGGGAPSIDAQLLVGNWISLPAGETCADVADFSSQEYALGIACVLANGDVDLVIEKGTYFVSNSKIVFSATQATCSEITKDPKNAGFAVSRTSLSISFSNRLIVYEPNTASSPMGSLSATYGCIRNGVFVPSPFAPL